MGRTLDGLLAPTHDGLLAWTLDKLPGGAFDGPLGRMLGGLLGLGRSAGYDRLLARRTDTRRVPRGDDPQSPRTNPRQTNSLLERSKTASHELSVGKSQELTEQLMDHTRWNSFILNHGLSST